MTAVASYESSWVVHVTTNEAKQSGFLAHRCCFWIAAAPRDEGCKRSIISGRFGRACASARANGHWKARLGARLDAILRQAACSAQRTHACASAYAERRACALPQTDGLCSALCFAYKPCAAVLSRLDACGTVAYAWQTGAPSAVLSALQNALPPSGPFGCAIGCGGARPLEYKCAICQETL
jgi:hypothetical protein